MYVDLSPEIRRVVMQYAATEDIDFSVALELVIAAGIRAIYESEDNNCTLVHKAG